MVKLNDDTIEAKLSEPGVVLVKFGAEWCGPCKALSATLADLESDYTDQIQFADVNVDHCPQATEKFGIVGVPATFIFKDGVRVDKFTGALPKSKINDILKKFV